MKYWFKCTFPSLWPPVCFVIRQSTKQLSHCAPDCSTTVPVTCFCSFFFLGVLVKAAVHDIYFKPQRMK
jgi:hypothetical protein